MPNTPIIITARNLVEGLELLVDGWPSHTHKLQSRVPDEPAAWNQSFASHAKISPPQITLTGYVSDLVLHDPTAEDSEAATVADTDRAAKAWAKIRQLHRTAETVRVITEWALYDSMLIEKAEATQVTQQSRGMAVRLDLKQVRRLPPPPPKPRRIGIDPGAPNRPPFGGTPPSPIGSGAVAPVGNFPLAGDPFNPGTQALVEVGIFQSPDPVTRMQTEKVVREFEVGLHYPNQSLNAALRRQKQAWARAIVADREAALHDPLGTNFNVYATQADQANWVRYEGTPFENRALYGPLPSAVGRPHGPFGVTVATGSERPGVRGVGRFYYLDRVADDRCRPECQLRGCLGVAVVVTQRYIAVEAGGLAFVDERISVTVTKHADGTQTTGHVAVYNLSDEETNRIEPSDAIRITAGDSEYGAGVIFDGRLRRIRVAHRREAGGTVTHLYLGDWVHHGGITARSYRGRVPPELILADLAADAGVEVGPTDQLPDVGVEDFSWSGRTVDALTMLLDPIGCAWYEDDGAIRVRCRGQSVQSDRVPLVAAPEVGLRDASLTEDGATAVTYLSALAQRGTPIDIYSPTVQGTWIVAAVTHRADNWEGPFESRLDLRTL